MGEQCSGDLRGDAAVCPQGGEEICHSDISAVSKSSQKRQGHSPMRGTVCKKCRCGKKQGI